MAINTIAIYAFAQDRKAIINLKKVNRHQRESLARVSPVSLMSQKS